MNRFFSTASPGSFGAALVLLAAIACSAQEPPVTDSPPTSVQAVAAAPGVDPSTGEDRDPTAPMSIEERKAQAKLIMEQFREQADDEVYQLGVEAVKVFEASAAQLQQSVLDMRKQHTLYVNGYNEDRSAYLDLRDQSRALIQETYSKALDVLNFVPHPDAVRFVVTVVETRLKKDVYDKETLEGAARLLDIGVRWAYVAQAGARAALIVGEFDLAKRMYEQIPEEGLADTDKRLLVQTDQIKQQFETEKQLLDNDPENLPQVVFHTTRGDITAKLFINEAPSTVSHFIQLVESGFYDGLDFFQVIEGLLALSGDPLGDGSTRPDRYLADEHLRETTRMPLAGSLIMAKLPLPGGKGFVPNSAGTQFAMLYTPLPPVVEDQTVFGRIVDGLDVFGSLRRVDPHKEKEKNAIVIPPDRILSAEIINRPETLPEVQYADPPANLPPL